MRVHCGLLAVILAFVPLASGAQQPPAPAATQLASNVAFLNAAYEVVLNRPLDAVGTNASLIGLNNGSLSRSQVVQQLIASPVFAQAEINAFYQRFLGRPASAGEASAFSAQLQAGGAASVVAAIAGSAEYYAKAGGTIPGFITKFYNDALGRGPTAAEEAAWLNMLKQATRPQVALNIEQSPEGSHYLLVIIFQGAMHQNGTPNGTTLLAAALAAIASSLPGSR
jgi:hypothetical protein